MQDDEVQKCKIIKSPSDSFTTLTHHLARQLLYSDAQFSEPFSVCVCVCVCVKDRECESNTWRVSFASSGVNASAAFIDELEAAYVRTCGSAYVYACMHAGQSVCDF